jgi:NAD(P)-dependent dehydrogenase (short-subunit alcohol dehydrogenase family)
VSRFAGRHALVTGGASGIGRAVAELLAAEGATVTTLDRSGGDLVADVTDAGAVDAALAGLEADLLVNSAGVYPVRALLDMTASDWDAVLDVNLRGAFLVGRAFARALNGRPGAIVNVASMAAERGDASEPSGHYAASKAGLLGLTRQMAVEWAPAIRANAVSPGVIDTPMLRLMDDPATGNAYVRERVPLGRLGDAGEVARAILFLLSDDASYITGATLNVDGGVTVA